MRANDEDTELMLRFQAGDEAAFSQLLRRNHTRVLSLAFRYLNDRAAAEDVAQEAFLKVYTTKERYEPRAPFGAYLLRIASNLCLSKLRRRKVRAVVGEPEDGAPEPVDPTPVAVERLESNELYARVRAAVDELPERQRLAILLNKFEGMDYQGVADQLGLSVAATKSLLHRARMALKERLEDCV
ncbi:MAG: RNA polymerase sigma factor [Planctomycetota bacterium]